MKIRSTTIIGLIKDGQAAIGGDGQVTLGNTVMKHNSMKIRKLMNGKVLTGFAGSTADAFTLLQRFEEKLEQYRGNVERAVVELAKDWRSDKVLRRLEAMLIVMDDTSLLLIAGTGEVIEPDDGILAIGSGGNYALAAGRALKRYAGEHMTAREIAKAALDMAGEICVYTNDNIIVEEL